MFWTRVKESPDSLKVIAVANRSNDSRETMKKLHETLDELSPGEDIYLVGHSRGASRANAFAKELDSRGVRVRGYVPVDFFEFFSSKRVADNVEQFLGFYSDPTSATKELRESQNAPHLPGSGEDQFDLPESTTNFGMHAIDETHQSIDSSEEVHESILSFVSGTLQLPPNPPACWECLTLLFRLHEGAAP